MVGIVIAYLLGLVVGAGLPWLGMLLERRRHEQTLVPRATFGTDGVTAQIPPPNTGYEPVYLSDAQIARLERGLGPAPVAPTAHEPIEASRR